MRLYLANRGADGGGSRSASSSSSFKIQSCSLELDGETAATLCINFSQSSEVCEELVVCDESAFEERTLFIVENMLSAVVVVNIGAS